MIPKKILLIDDDIRVGNLIQRFLFEEKYQVTVVNNGKEGIEQALRIVPDIIFCDIMMPETDGYEVLSQIRANGSTKKIPFIFVTAKSDTADFLTGMSKGADGYFSKPITREDLVELIETHTM